MHDPKSVAFELFLGKRKKKNGEYRSPFITIWHVDPETDGTDDSCGHFLRVRHIPTYIVEEVKKEFNFNYDYWFKKDGEAEFSVSGTILNMYSQAAWTIFRLQNENEIDRKKYNKFMRKHVVDILLFSENNVDSIGDYITNKWEQHSKESRVNTLSDIITCDIFNKLRKWYQHPRWHIRHWEVRFTYFRNLRRRYWDKCSVCGKRGFKKSAFGDWSGNIWHPECNNVKKGSV